MTAMIPLAREFHISLRVTDLAASTRFYEAFFGTAPKDRTARYSTFIVPELALNFVLLVNDKGDALDTYSLCKRRPVAAYWLGDACGMLRPTA